MGRCLYNLAVRILLLNLYYPPDTSATAKMAQTIVDALSPAHEVTVVCGRPSYEPTERRSWRLWRTVRAGAFSPPPTPKSFSVGSRPQCSEAVRAGAPPS